MARLQMKIFWNIWLQEIKQKQMIYKYSYLNDETMISIFQVIYLVAETHFPAKYNENYG